MIEQEYNEEVEKELSPKEELEALASEIEAEDILSLKKTKEFLKRNKAGEAIPMAEQKLHQEHARMISQLRKSYNALYKIVYPKGSAKESVAEGAPNMAKVLQMKPSIGSIITKVHQ